MLPGRVTWCSTVPFRHKLAQSPHDAKAAALPRPGWPSSSWPVNLWEPASGRRFNRSRLAGYQVCIHSFMPFLPIWHEEVGGVLYEHRHPRRPRCPGRCPVTVCVVQSVQNSRNPTGTVPTCFHLIWVKCKPICTFTAMCHIRTWGALTHPHGKCKPSPMKPEKREGKSQKAWSEEVWNLVGPSASFLLLCCHGVCVC